MVASKNLIFLFIRLLLFIGFVYLLTGGKPFGFIKEFPPILPILFSVTFLTLVFSRGALDWFIEKQAKIPDAVFLPVFLGSAFALLVTANIFVIEKVPHVTDSIAYLFQAKAIANGHFNLPAQILPEFFTPHFFYLDGDRLISVFQHGWPFVLSLGVLAGSPWLVNPILATLILLVVFLTIKRDFGSNLARLTIVLLVFSPFFLFLSSSFMSHTLSCLLGLCSMYFALKYKNNQSVRTLILSMVCIGFLFNVRAFNALLLVPPVIYILATDAISGRLKLKHFIIATIIGASVASLQLAVNLHQTGDIFTFSQEVYFAKTEAVPTCHRLGFGDDIGCEHEHGQFSFPDGFHFKDAVNTTFQRFRSLSINFLSSSIILILFAIPVLSAQKKRQTVVHYLLFCSLIFGYFFFFYHGNCYGPRFYFEAIGSLAFLVVLGTKNLDDSFSYLGNTFIWIRSVLRAIAPAIIISISLFTVIWLSPKLWVTYKHFRGIDDNMIKVLDIAGVKENAVVLMPGNDITFSFGANFSSYNFDDDIIFARHLSGHSTQLFYHFKDRDFYRFHPFRNRLIKLKDMEYQGVIFIEMEHEVPPIETVGGFGYKQGIVKFKPENPDAAMLQFDTEETGSYFTFNQYIFEEGDYIIEVEAIEGPFMGNWQLQINDQNVGKKFKGYTDKYSFVKWFSETPIHLKKGNAKFKFLSIGKDEKARSMDMGLDWMVIRRFPDAVKKPIPQIERIGYMEHGKMIPSKDGWAPTIELD